MTPSTHTRQIKPYPILQLPEEGLQRPSIPVKDPSSRHVNDIVEIMLATVREKGLAAGLAAPQIGFNEQIIICSIDRTPESMVPMINPSYIVTEQKTKSEWEMCFSIAHAAAYVPRYHKIYLQYYDLKGKLHQTEVEGFLARVVQHECDHLQGTLCSERALEKKSFEDTQVEEEFKAAVRAQHGH